MASNGDDGIDVVVDLCDEGTEASLAEWNLGSKIYWHLQYNMIRGSVGCGAKKYLIGSVASRMFKYKLAKPVPRKYVRGIAGVKTAAFECSSSLYL